SEIVPRGRTVRSASCRCRATLRPHAKLAVEKWICLGCFLGVYKTDEKCKCPFCRTPNVQEEQIRKHMMEIGDAEAFHLLGAGYAQGTWGLSKAPKKALEHLLRAGELGCAESYALVAKAYLGDREVGLDVEIENTKAKHYFQLSTIGGSAYSRHILGQLEANAGNIDIALKHWLISAYAGWDPSLDSIRFCYKCKVATKGDYEKALRAHKSATDDMKSPQRDTAAEQFGSWKSNIGPETDQVK
ncbi:hypothetical protein ACHAWF_006264, partial [Thalassiosira exigua]